RAYARPWDRSGGDRRGICRGDPVATRLHAPRLSRRSWRALPRMKRLALLALAPLLIAASDPATETEHVVKEGETLNGIANRARVPAAVIAAANGLAEPYAVKAGQRLAIPRQRIHLVEPGETGFAIAIRYGVTF